MRLFRCLAILQSALSAATTTAHDPRASAACNNSPDLCSRSYGEITHLGAHDSPFVRDESTGFSLAGNQFYNTTVQLSAGVRLVTAQVHRDGDELHLCHTSCSLLDAGTLGNWLSSIKMWLDENPNDVITILLVNSDNVSAQDLHAEFTRANIVAQAYSPESTTTTTAPRRQTWPTLQDLISNRTRLLVFVASLPDSNNARTSAEVAPYLMDEFTFIFENQYEVTSPMNFSCLPHRPSSVRDNTSAALARNLLPLVNHFLGKRAILDIIVPDVDRVAGTNSPVESRVGTLGNAAKMCSSEYAGRQPTFLLVDFFDRGPAIEVVDGINGVERAVGRKAVGNGTTRERKTSAAVSGEEKNPFRGVARVVRAGYGCFQAILRGMGW
ncbi:hypothetical protein AJ80_03061 [Polytolypa hystricis UAMH7299]|uniref:Phosphatidylinositol-specific phospholipase C X domain-containing protein n=1 Tax=Polytolypa hystricis (strain UAMH7299) TaxID=1447883 RepID=A0A2B7YLA0_POLH7|nr:hypothetical protein AJ80_03061 [Polytolypa hystricis UAMH7299]